MKSLTVFLFALLCVSTVALGQNVGIGNNNPLDKLHVSGFIRSTALANTDTNVVMSDFNGRLINLAPGASGLVLKSQGAGRAPVWGPVPGTVQVYNASAVRTNITTTTFTQVTGLTQTVTLTSPATVIVSTYGSMETWSTSFGGSGTIVQLFRDGVAVPNSFQTHDINDAAGFTGTIAPWSFNAYMTLAAGTYTFTVRARKYAFDNFYAGGNTTSPSPNEGALTVMVIY